MKNRLKGIFLFLLVLVVYTLLYFLIPVDFHDEVTHYLNYALPVFLAILVWLPLLFLERKEKNRGLSMAMAYPFFKGAVIASVELLVLTVVFYLVNAFVDGLSFWIVLLFYLVGSLWYPFLFLAKKEAKEQMADSATALSEKTQRMKEILLKAKSFESGLSGESKKKVSELVEALRYSDPISTDETREIENRIDKDVSALPSLPVDSLDKAVNSLLFLIRQRNVLVKEGKKNL